MEANKLKLSNSFQSKVKAYADTLLKTDGSEKFGNLKLISIGHEIAKAVIPELSSTEIHSLMSFNTSSLSHMVISSGQSPALQDTPYDGLISSRKIIEPVLFLTAIHALLGLHPVVYEGENDGEIVRNVVPAKKSANAISSHGSKVAFGGHVDNPDLPFFDNVEVHSVSIPDNLSLYCLKQQSPSVSTDVIQLDDIVEKMSHADTSLLMKPVFIIERPASFSGYTENYVQNVPLLARNNRGQYISRFDTHRVSSKDKAAASALAEFRKIGADENLKLKLDLECGDFVIFKNKRTLHSRGAFNPVFDGNDRWLLRVFSMNALPHTEILVQPEDPAHLKTNLNAFNLNEERELS